MSEEPEEGRGRGLEQEDSRWSPCPGAGPGPSPSSMGRAGSGPPGPRSSKETKDPSPPPPASCPPPPASPPSGAHDQDSDSEEAVHPQQQNRTRQKKFVKNFKQLPSEEVVLQRYSCALMGDILLQGHLYVTENYIAFHSNVFGYVTRIQIPMISITSFTKEKTAKIIPNAVAVTTPDDTHTFTSFISREATYKVMTKAWRRALARHNLANLNNEDLGDDENDEDVEDVDGYIQTLDDESTDSMTSAYNLDAVLPLKPDVDTKNPYLVKRLSGGGGIFYQERHLAAGPGVGGAAGGAGHLSQESRSWLQQVLVQVASYPPSTLVLGSLTGLLVLLLCSSIYLVLRLDSIQSKVDSALPTPPSNLEQLANWQSLLHTQSSKKVQEYLNTNLEQISKVRESLEKLAHFLHSHQESAAREE